MATTRVVLNFYDDNDTGANDNVGYRIYRKEFQDPCPDNLPVANALIHSENTVPEGKQTLEFVDDTVEEGKTYFYRVSFTRGIGVSFEEVVSRNAIGPIVVKSAYNLAYPGTIPGPDSGVPNYTSIAPIVHYDAFDEMSRLGYDYEYKEQEYIQNLSKEYDIKVRGYRDSNKVFHLEYWNKYSNEGANQSLDIVWMREDSYWHNYNDLLPASFNVSDIEEKIKQKWIEPDDFSGNIIFDQGIVSFFVVGGSSQHISKPTSHGQPYSFSHGNSFQATGFFSKNTVSINTNLYDGVNQDQNPNKANRWSDGKYWIHPNPIEGMADPVSPNSLAPGISISNVDFNLGFSMNSGAVYNYLSIGSDERGFNTVNISGDKDALHLFVKVVYPDGSSSLYQNGKLLIHEEAPLKIFGEIPANGYIDQAGLRTAGEEAGIDVYPMLTFRKPINMLTMGVANIAESILYPEKLSLEDFMRCIAYFQDKYQTLENQEAYTGY